MYHLDPTRHSINPFCFLIALNFPLAHSTACLFWFASSSSNCLENWQFLQGKILYATKLIWWSSSLFCFDSQPIIQLVFSLSSSWRERNNKVIIVFWAIMIFVWVHSYFHGDLNINSLLFFGEVLIFAKAGNKNVFLVFYMQQLYTLPLRALPCMLCNGMLCFLLAIFGFWCAKTSGRNWREREKVVSKLETNKVYVLLNETWC